ncbi:MAG: hypothetical protein HY318_20720 [Armatimonadetes bacterium]|nr:hypothetical protein [Armatimonadota bacterium]
MAKEKKKKKSKKKDCGCGEPQEKVLGWAPGHPWPDQGFIDGIAPFREENDEQSKCTCGKISAAQKKKAKSALKQIDIDIKLASSTSEPPIGTKTPCSQCYINYTNCVAACGSNQTCKNNCLVIYSNCVRTCT